MNKQELQEKVIEYSKIEEWNHSYIFPFGITTNDNIKKSPGHNVNKWKRLESIFENLDISDKSIIDVGCSDGYYSNKCAELGAKNVLGIDPDDLRINRAKFASEILNINNVEFKNLDIVSSNVDLSGLEVETAGDSERAFILKAKLTSFLNDFRGSYDYILVDCPPSLSLLTVMALVSSHSLVVPLQTEFFALEGLTQLIKTIERIKTNLNPELNIRGILLTMYDKRNKLSSQVEKEARDFFKEKVYTTVIPRNVRLSEAPSHGMPVLIYDRLCPGSKSYFSFTDEFINQDENIGSAA